LITTRQVKAARALLGWSQADLAQHSGVSEPTVARLESVDGKLGGREDTAKKIKTAIEIAGIEFIDENGGGRGVRLRRRARPRGQRSGWRRDQCRCLASISTDLCVDPATALQLRFTMFGFVLPIAL